MSLVNLLGALAQPQYPSMFLVLYRSSGEQTTAEAEAQKALEGRISGAIGVASGEIPDPVAVPPLIFDKARMSEVRSG